MVAIGVFVHPDGRVGAAGGYLLQAMPGADAGSIDRLEENVATAPPPSEIVRAGIDAAGMVSSLMAGFRPGVLDEQPVWFQCRCSRERVESAILALGRDEMLDVLINRTGRVGL